MKKTLMEVIDDITLILNDMSNAEEWITESVTERRREIYNAVADDIDTYKAGIKFLDSSLEWMDADVFNSMVEVIRICIKHNIEPATIICQLMEFIL